MQPRATRGGDLVRQMQSPACCPKERDFPTILLALVACRLGRRRGVPESSLSSRSPRGAAPWPPAARDRVCWSQGTRSPSAGPALVSREDSAPLPEPLAAPPPKQLLTNRLASPLRRAASPGTGTGSGPPTPGSPCSQSPGPSPSLSARPAALCTILQLPCWFWNFLSLLAGVPLPRLPQDSESLFRGPATAPLSRAHRPGAPRGVRPTRPWVSSRP